MALLPALILLLTNAQMRSTLENPQRLGCGVLVLLSEMLQALYGFVCLTLIVLWFGGRRCRSVVGGVLATTVALAGVIIPLVGVRWLLQSPDAKLCGQIAERFWNVCVSHVIITFGASFMPSVWAVQSIMGCIKSLWLSERDQEHATSSTRNGTAVSAMDPPAIHRETIRKRVREDKTSS